MFNQKLPKELYNGKYQPIACDGSAADFFRNPDDPDTFFEPNGQSSRGVRVGRKGPLPQQSIKAQKVFAVSGARGKINYAKVSGSKKLSINENGKITVAKGTNKGTYKMKVSVTAAGDTNYNAKTVEATVRVRVKK